MRKKIPSLLHLGVEVLDDGDIVTDLMDLNPPRSSSDPPPLRLLHLDDEVLDDADIVTDLMVLNPPRSSSEFPPPPIPRPDIVGLRIKYPRNYNILLSIMHSYIPH